jgi:DNA-binding response OmpR family regulator
MSSLGRILVADDEETFLESTADLLREEGYACDCVMDAQNAVAMLSKNDYDLLIADIKMPGNLELELIRGLRDLSNEPSVILITGYPSLDTAIMSIQLSVSGYLLKPINFNELLPLVRESVARFRAFRVFSSSRARLRDLREELQALETFKNFSSGGISSVDTEDFLNFTIKNILSSLVDLKDLAQALAKNRPKQDVCQLLNCPKHVELTETLKEVMYTLRKIKSASRNKEIGKLHKKLERMFSGITASTE